MEEKRKDGGTPPASASYGEIPASEAPVNSRRRGGGLKRKASSLSATPPTGSSKRQARERLDAVPFPPIHNYPLTRARQQPSASAVAASPSEGTIEVSDVSGREVGIIEQVKLEQELNETSKVNWQDLEEDLEAAIEAIRNRDANVHVVPNHAGWFSWATFHPLEEKTLPSFFNGKVENRTPKIYLEIRNWIMKKFHANPNIQIELNDLTEIEVGDMETKKEVMEFLDYWGLINYHPFPKTDITIVDDAGKAENTDSLLKSLFRFESEHSCMPVIPRNSVSTPAAQAGLLPESAVAEDLIKLEGPNVEYHCNSCSADCSRKRYHCQKQADFDLCPECFNNGMFGSDMSPSDFILMEPAESGGTSSGKWTDQETLLLLEALELFSENWNEIAEHVATKTKAQCILHFVQMPIVDMFFDNSDEKESTSKEHVDTVSVIDEEKESTSKEHVDTVSVIDDNTVPKAAIEVTEVKNELNDNPLSSVDKSKHEEVEDSHLSKEGENLVMKALNEAFKNGGLFSSPGGHLSFAEAANPVMTLAAFLINLVEPNIATLSVRNSLKLISGSSGDQLTLRNCFCLEDPPDEKQSTCSERIDTKMDVRETEKDEDENIEKQKSDMAVDSLCVSNDENTNSSKEPTRKEVKPLTSSVVNLEVGHPTNKFSDTNTFKMPEPAQCMESSMEDDHSKIEPGIAEGSGHLTMEVEVPPGFEREPGDSAILVKPSESTDVPIMNTNLLLAATSNSTDENGVNKEDENGKLKTKNDDESSINKIRNAAVTTISALSVKAKFLANKEEQQIRQLAAMLIEKQLLKIELKLSFLNEMESLIMRVREDLERSRMRLFNERSQIIATRLGISGSRPMQQPYPVNRSGMMAPLGNSAPRPQFSGMSSQRPPVSRPIMMSSNPSQQDQVSSTNRFK